MKYVKRPQNKKKLNKDILSMYINTYQCSSISLIKGFKSLTRQSPGNRSMTTVASITHACMEVCCTQYSYPDIMSVLSLQSQGQAQTCHLPEKPLCAV